MKILILDGSPAGDRIGEFSVAALQADVAERGSTSEVVALRDKKIGNCMGDFFCWFKSPGKCHVADDHQEISRKYLESDLVIFLSPITFGGYSPTLKRMVDHMIQNTLPFFATHSGEIHHLQRYERYPDVLTIGWQREPDEQSAAIFRHLAWRNSINFYAKVHACGVLCENQADRIMEAELHRLLDQIERHESEAAVTLPVINRSSEPPVALRRALLLVGSPRLEKSTSSSLGSYLFEQLNQHGVETETIFLYKAINTPERMEALRQAIQRADLVVLAFPLYVDTLPAPVISVLENVVTNGTEKSKPTRFAAIVNCGFPEASQNDSAVALCAEFSRAAGFEWMGGLSLGAGEGMVQARALREMGGQGASLRQALDGAAGELAQGKAVSDSALSLLAKPLMPQWMYRLGGTIGWKMRARKFGTQKQLNAKPYEKAV